MVIKNKTDGNKHHDFCVDYIEEPERDCCEKPDLFETTEGEIVCRNCGICHGSRMVSQERRAYTRDEIKSRKTSVPVSGWKVSTACWSGPVNKPRHVAGIISQ